MTYRYPRYRYYGYRSRRGLTSKQAAGAVAAAVVLAGAVATGHHHHGGTPQPQPQPAAQAGAAIAYARAQIGKPYAWGGTGPGGFDCSGLVMMAYQSAGVSIPRTSEVQWADGHRVSSPQRGDLVFFAGADGTPAAPGHVGLVLRVTGPRSGVMIQAYTSGTDVMVSTFGLPTSLEGVTGPIGFTRPVPLAHTLTVSTTSYTPASWARALLRKAGYPRTACTLAAVTAWEGAEGDWTHGHAGWHNLLNDKLSRPGSSPVTSDGVQRYTSWAQGLDATAATLGGPDYGGIRAALAAGNDAQAIASAIMASPWAASRYNGTLTANC